MNRDFIIKLGKRLDHIASMVIPKYDHIWDCCCDHGLLGAALLSRQAAPYIHFVDLVPRLMSELEIKLARFFPVNVNAQWRVHCMDMTRLSVQEYTGRHLVIIAGVGGDLMSEFVKAICQNNPTAEIDFLLCPVHHEYTLRQQLIALNVNLNNESLMVENHRFYEVIWVSTNRGILKRSVSSVGDLIWQCKNQQEVSIASDYLRRTLAHYNRKQLKPGSAVEHIVNAYNAVRLQKQF